MITYVRSRDTGFNNKREREREREREKLAIKANISLLNETSPICR